MDLLIALIREMVSHVCIYHQTCQTVSIKYVQHFVSQLFLFNKVILKMWYVAGHRWLMPVILTIQEAEIRRITVLNQPWQIVHETLS
jgi:hypothetical protein